jgi:hypothetical protein
MVARSKLSCGDGGRGGAAQHRRAEPGHDVAREGAEELRGGEMLPAKKEGRSREIGMATNSGELRKTPA